MRSFTKRLFLLTLLLSNSTLLAQRGKSFNHQIEPANQPLSGFPGYFDTNLVAPRGMVIDLPPLLYVIPMPMSFFDYGVNEKTTVGTNLVTDFLPFLLGGYGASGKVRSLVYGSSQVQSVVTLYSGYARIKMKEKESEKKDDQNDESATLGSATSFMLNYLHISSNTTYIVNPRLLVTGQVAFAKYGFQLNEPNDTQYVKADILAGMIGGQVQWFIEDWYGFAASGLYPMFQKFTVDSPDASIGLSDDSNFDIRNALFTFGRASAQFKYGDDWLFEVGLLHLQPIFEGALWFGATVKL